MAMKVLALRRPGEEVEDIASGKNNFFELKEERASVTEV